MEDFIGNYPGVIISIAGAIVIIFGVLLSIIGWMVRNSYNRLTDTLKQNTILVNRLDHRISTQETICDMCRKNCPYHLGRDVEVAFNSGSIPHN